MTYQLLRLEAINLRYCIDDTENLSTRRAGGYMLLQAVRDLEDENGKFSKSLEPISTGASIGLFSIKGDAEKLAQEVRSHLHETYSHATFAVDIVQDDRFRIAVEKSVSKNRWHQMQSLSFATQWGQAAGVCGHDMVRPSAADKQHKSKATSQSVDVRSQNGRKLRQKFYEKELKELAQKCALPEDAFTENIEQLAKIDDAKDTHASIPSNLNGKMAVFYADGNSFGSIQRGCEDDEALREWDKDLKQKRRELLADLICFMQSTPLGKTSDGRLRLETLLWGGDEMLFLMPAWLGLEFAQRFFELTKGWEHGGHKLTHAAGLVFVKHSAPISPLQKLVKALADNGKAHDKSQNTLSWVVLESFDHVGDDMENYWRRNAIQNNGWGELLLTQEKITELRKLIPPLKEDLPRSAMIRVLRSLAAGKAGEKDELELLQRSYESTNAALNEEHREAFKKLWRDLSQGEWQSNPQNIPATDAVAWTVLLELWDYLLPDASDVEVSEGAAL